MIDFRSNCPICSTLDIIGDKWSLIVVRDMLIKYKSTFKELIDFDEKIATFEDDAGAYDQKDAEGFIRLNGLRLAIEASRGRDLSK